MVTNVVPSAPGLRHYTMEPEGWQVRKADLDLVTSLRARDIIEEEGASSSRGIEIFNGSGHGRLRPDTCLTWFKQDILRNTPGRIIITVLTD